LFGFLNKRPEPVSQSNSLKFEKILGNKITLEAIPYILELWHAHPFSFTVARSRKSCLGNYMYKNKHHFISVNGDSNPFSFLITLVHEIAHQRVTIKFSGFRKKPQPHGNEWKSTFKELIDPLLNGKVFPGDLEKILVKHMKNPAASSTKDPDLVKALGLFSGNTDGIVLSEIKEGGLFIFGKRSYRKLSDRRTRTLVECISTKRRFTIASHAVIETISSTI
jgi:hypothetical protein